MSRNPPPVHPGDDQGRRGADSTTPSELAREALRRLAMERMAPTPDNYRTFYHQIAGTVAEDVFPERALKSIAAALPRHTPEAVRLGRVFEAAVGSGQWPPVRQAVIDLFKAGSAQQPDWAPLIRDLGLQLERTHAGLSAAQKREALNRVVSTAASAEQLHTRLLALVRSWAAMAEAGPAAAPAEDSAECRADGDGALRPLVVQLLRHGVAPLLGEDEDLAAEARALADSLEASAAASGPDALADRLSRLAERLAWVGEDQQAVRKALLGLLQLIIDNIRELMLEDSWLSGQLGLLAEAFAGPLNIRVLDEVERRLRDVIEKQGRLKAQLNEAQDRLKHMLAGFVDQLAHFSAATGSYHGHLERSAGRIAAARDIGELSEVVEELLSETRSVQETALRSKEELANLREQVDVANRHIARLQLELDHTSELVRHDPLTGALNRKGLDEALAREIARARRREASLCIALLDVDNFKQINDTYGHAAGDDALRHLAQVVREALRPQDAVGRYGGEEFLIILPETEVDQALAIITRLQRELTRRFFLTDRAHLLITFSAGVTRLTPDEEVAAAIDRADKAMYAAKRAGKNRVLVAP